MMIKLDIHTQKNDSFSSLTMHKSHFQMNQQPECKTWTFETPAGRVRKTLQDIVIGKDCQSGNGATITCGDFMNLKFITWSALCLSVCLSGNTRVNENIKNIFSYVGRNDNLLNVLFLWK